MAITENPLTNSNNSANQTSYATASITPGANRLVLLTVESAPASGAPNVPTATGNGLTWVLIDSQVDDAGLRLISLFRALGASPSTGAITIDFAGQTQDWCLWSVIEFAGVDTSGSNGSGAVRQSAKNHSVGSGLFTVTLAAFGDAGNAAMGCFGGDVGDVIAGGSGFTVVTQQQTGAGGPWEIGVSFMTEYELANDTTVDATYTASANRVGIAVEIQISPPAPTVLTNDPKDVSTTRATGVGNVTAGASITERGFVWATHSNPTTADSKVVVAGTLGAYTGPIGGLTPNTVYHYRAYAINSGGTSYGADVQFVTVPIVVTTAGGVLTISGPGLAIETVEDNTYYGKNISGDVATQLTALLASQAQPWTAQVEGTPTQPNFRADGMSTWAVMQQMAQIAGGYIRDNPTLRRIDFRTSNQSSGLRIRNVESVGPGIADAIIATLRGYREDASGIVNRVVPFGAGSADVPFDLALATRSSPYVVQNLTPIAPAYAIGTAAAVSTAYQVAASSGTVVLTGLTRSGRNRALVIVSLSNVNLSPTALSIRGQGLTKYGTFTVSTDRTIDVWYLLNPPAGSDPLDLTYNLPARTGAGQVVTIYFQAFADVDQVTPIAGDASANGTSNAPSVSISPVATDYLLNGLVVVSAADVITNDPAWTQIWKTFGIVATLEAGHAGSANPVAVNYSLSSSLNWLTVTVRVKGARQYYIEDAASEAAYRKRVGIVQAKDVHLIPTDPVNSANALYDVAATYLQRSKDPLIVYGDTDPVNLPRGSWLVGDTLRLDYRGLVDIANPNQAANPGGTVTKYLDINADVIVTGRTQIFDADGVRRWKLTLANGLKRPVDMLDVAAAAGQLQRLPAL